MRALTVEGWQYLVLSVMAVVVLVGAVTTAVLLTRTDRVSGQLTNNVGPARVAAYQLQAALRDQETAVRGYVISADPQFLSPYDAGRETESRASADLRQFEQKRPDLLADLDEIEQAAGSWRDNYAQPVIAAVQPGVPNAVSPALTEIGKAEFDRLRTLFDQQNQHLAQARTDGVAELASISAWRNGVLFSILGAFSVTMVVLAIVLRRALVRPLGRLAEACRRVAVGNFGEKIVPQGPRDIRLIAIDVDNMRQRIVEELNASRAATEALDEQAEELRRSNAELEQFAYVASHDLQEPLRKVASFCQLLEKRYGDKLDERGTEYIAFAVDGAKRMQVLINDLLTFSRVGRLGATETAVDLDTVLDAALANVATAIEETGAQIERPTGGLPTISGDPTLLTMLWQNLIGNAVKFRREGVAPRVVIECGSADADQWSFSVSDNGIGIAAEFAEKVFVIFQRLHGRDAYTGTGIGLALCKKIVEHHGGTIWIDNDYTDGTRFRFTLPKPRSDKAAIPDAAVSGNAAPLMEGSSS
ncbi:MAG: CHASE3 domain-containing protein [Mycobacterium kyogaense]|uniref:sensor histidine kinase n=1 Tax=Mycobacterium kyogaense TaxID=2212479 RepID=UPI002FFD380D